jgi:hypothetical protein
MARLAPREETDSSKPKSPIQIARTCYDHLAGWESGSQRLLSGNVTLQIIWPNFLRTIWHN